MIIRPMQKEDIPAVINGELKIFNHTLGEMLYSEIEKKYASFFVCEENGIIGYIGLWHLFDQGEILNFYIDKEYQGLKYGLNLLTFAIDYLYKQGVRSITLEVRITNNKAISLYEKLGFIKASIRKNYYPDKEDALLMIKEM